MALFESLFTRLYDPLFEPPLQSVRAVTRALIDQVAPCAVLDVCSGTGTQVRALRDRGHRAYGADLSPDMIRLARRRLPPDATPRQNAKALAYRDGAFDLVLASMALHEKPAPTARAMLAEMVRVTRSGGHLLLVDYAVGPDVTRLGRAVTFTVERLVGGRHYQNYRTFMQRGGLEWLVQKLPLERMERRCAGGDAIEARLYRRP